jgi:hypothetical protein
MGSSLGKMLGGDPAPQKEKQTMWKSGANFKDRNEIIKLARAGHSIDQIRAFTKVNTVTIGKIISQVRKEVQGVDHGLGEEPELVDHGLDGEVGDPPPIDDDTPAVLFEDD